MRRRFRRSTSDPTPDPKSDEADPSDGATPSEEADRPAEADRSDDGADGRAPSDGPGGPSFDVLLARQLERADEIVDEVGEVAGTDAHGRVDFWDHYDQAAAEAELAVVPPAAVVAIVGSLQAALPVIRRCQDRHWMGDCDVFVLTQQPLARLQGPDEPPWTAVARPSDLVAVLEEGRSDFPLLVLDVPPDLPAFVRPLVARLRDGGVGLVHYVLDGEPVDEDLATWHGELGRPSVLDLAGPVPADRVLELIERGEPVVSVAGRELSAELLLALRVERLTVDRV